MATLWYNNHRVVYLYERMNGNEECTSTNVS